MYCRPYVSLRYNKQNVNNNISETQYKQLQAQGYYLRFENVFVQKICTNTSQTEISQKKEPRLLFFFSCKKRPRPSLNSNLTTRRSTIEIRSFGVGFFFFFLPLLFPPDELATSFTLLL